MESPRHHRCAAAGDDAVVGAAHGEDAGLAGIDDGLEAVDTALAEVGERDGGRQGIRGDVQSEVHNPAGAPEHVILRAARLCPTSAIRVEVAGTGEVLFP